VVELEIKETLADSELQERGNLHNEGGAEAPTGVQMQNLCMVRGSSL